MRKFGLFGRQTPKSPVKKPMPAKAFLKVDQLEDREVPSISPIVTENGFITLSTDGLGTLSNTGTVRVQKPAGATVRSAYLLSATIASDNPTITPSSILLNGNNVTFSNSVTSTLGGKNYFGNVTSIVKPIIDAAPVGINNLTVTENVNMDGEILAVIFNDPSVTVSNTVVLLFGTQLIAGDTFAIGLGQPIDKTDPNLALDLSLGISFSFQGGGSQQFSQVDVNSKRLTTAAGGNDDGTGANGALLTVGGIGDSNANPANPLATPTTDRSDDELYSLLPYVNNGDTSISVFTTNPSNNDNIFFAALNLKSTSAIVGEGILLSPLTASAAVGGTASATATLQNDLGAPIVNRNVTFTVTSGPNAGKTFTGATDSTGKVIFTYTDTNGAGTDTIGATFVNNASVVKTSNSVTRTFVNVSATISDITVGFGSKSYSLVNNTANLPWVDISTISVKYTTTSTTVTQNDLQLTGINVPSYAFSGFSFNSETNTATWTLTTFIGPDRLHINLASVSTYPAGTQNFNVLPGDFNGDGVVTIQDSVGVRNQTPPYGGSYALFADMDGSGVIDINDINAPRRRLGSTLPSFPNT